MEEAFFLLYGKNRSDVWQEFCLKSEKTPVAYAGPAGGDAPGWSLSDVKEFTYWLFKLRVNLWDPARVASDTRKAMQKLSSLELVPVTQPIESIVDLWPA